MRAKIITIVVLLVFVVIFAVTNVNETNLRFLFWTFQLPTINIILVSFVAGILMGLLLWGLGKGKKHSENRS